MPDECFQCGKWVDSTRGVMRKVGEDEQGETLMSMMPHCEDCFEEVTQ